MKMNVAALALAVPLSLLAAGLLRADAPCPLRDAVECSPRSGLPHVFAALSTGGEARVAFLGGSITAQDGWRPKTLAWLRGRFPGAKIGEINAAIGGTGSDLGVFRLDHDVLERRPDLLFVEFAVNDGGAAPERIHKAMEGIVRKTWAANPATDICFVYTVAENMLPDLEAGHFPRSASAMEAVAEHYGIPSIHMGLEAARLVKAGQLVFKANPQTDEEKKALAGKTVFSPDGVHPHPDTGHRLYLEAVARSLERIQALPKAERPAALPPPLRADNWERARMIPLSAASRSDGWEHLDAGVNALAKSFGNRLPELWRAGQPGAKLTLRFKGTLAGVYDLLGPDGGQVSVQLDGGPARVVPRFDGYCTYHRLAMLMAGEELPEGMHTVTFTLDAGAPDKAAILFEHNRPDLRQHPEKYAANVWHAGALMLIGEPVP